MEDMPLAEEKHDSEYLFYDFKNRAAGKGTSLEKRRNTLLDVSKNKMDSHQGQPDV